jgi:hypothetical protein
MANRSAGLKANVTMPPSNRWPFLAPAVVSAGGFRPRLMSLWADGVCRGWRGPRPEFDRSDGPRLFEKHIGRPIHSA